jgi:hypothetical protein
MERLIMFEEKSINIEGREFMLVAKTRNGGQTLTEVYFSADHSSIKVEIDYTFTEKGYK